MSSYKVKEFFLIMFFGLIGGVVLACLVELFEYLAG